MNQNNSQNLQNPHLYGHQLLKRETDFDEDAFEFSDTDEGIMKEGLNNFEHKKMFQQSQGKNINQNNNPNNNENQAFYNQMHITSNENTTQFQQSLPQTTQASQISTSMNNYKRMSPQKHQQDVKPNKLQHEDDNTLQQQQQNKQKQNTQQFERSKGQMNKSQSSSFLHSKRNTTEIGNRENIDVFNRTQNTNNTTGNQISSYHLQNSSMMSYQQAVKQTNQNDNSTTIMNMTQKTQMGYGGQYQQQHQSSDADFKRAYQKLAKEMQNINPNFVPQSARQTYLGVNGGVKQDYSMKTFDRSNVSIMNNNNNEGTKKFNLQEFTQKQFEFEEKKKQKLAQLQEQIEIQGIEECTFMPNKHRSQSANRTGRRYNQQQNRNTEQFLEDQYKKEEERQMKLNLQSEMLNIKQKEELKGKPQINQKSKKLIEKKLSQQHNQQDVHNRLYELNNKQKHQYHQQLGMQNNIYQQFDNNNPTEKSRQNIIDLSKTQNSNLSFKPQIHKKSQQLKRNKPIDQHLYEDFKNRQQKKEQLKQDINQQEQHNMQIMSSKQLSHNSEKYFIQRFTKEIIRQWQTLSLDEVSQSNETLNYLIYKEFMVRLGFLDERMLGSSYRDTESSQQQDQDKNIIYDLWKHLGGEVKGHITLNNLRIFLLAIMGTFVEPGIKRNEQNLFRLDEQVYGQFNDQGDLFLDPSEIQKIQKEFYQFYLNRTQYESKQRELRKQERMEKVEHDFKPQVNHVSKDIAEKYREKMEHVVQTKLSTIDWLVQPAKNPKWQETAQEIVLQEQLKECTFQPQISKRKDSARGKSQELLSHFRNRKDSSQSASKIRSRELMPNTGNRFNDLFELSKKMQPLKESKDKSTQDYEYEKMQNECSFKPQILKQSQENSFFKNTMNQSQSLANIHSTQKSIERMNRARQEKEQLEQIKQSGKHRNNIDRQGLAEMQSPNRSMINKSMTSSASALMTKSINKSQVREKQTNQVARNQKEFHNQQAFDDYLGANFSQHNSNNNNNISDLNEIDTITQQKNQNQINDYINQNNNIANSFPQTPNEQQLQQQQQLQQIQQLPLLYVDINLGEGNMERITVFPGDTATELAQKFANIHGLEEETMLKLKDLLEQQIQNVLVNNNQNQ